MAMTVRYGAIRTVRVVVTLTLGVRRNSCACAQVIKEPGRLRVLQPLLLRKHLLLLGRLLLLSHGHHGRNLGCNRKPCVEGRHQGRGQRSLGRRGDGSVRIALEIAVHHRVRRRITQRRRRDAHALIRAFRIVEVALVVEEGPSSFGGEERLCAVVELSAHGMGFGHHP